MHPLIVEQVATAKVAEDHRRAEAQRRANAARSAPRAGARQAAVQVVAALTNRAPHRPAQPRVARTGHAVHGRR